MKVYEENRAVHILAAKPPIQYIITNYELGRKETETRTRGTID